MSTPITTGEVRFSYVHVFQPDTQGTEPKYRVTLLLPKSDLASKAAIDNAINIAIDEGVSKSWGGIRPPQLDICVHDGDGVRQSDGQPFGAECKGHWVFKASTKTAPFVVDANVQAILQATEVYSGCYGRANVRFFPYNTSGNKGVGCILNGIQKLRDGEPLSNRITAAEAFGAPAAGGYDPLRA